MRIASAQPTAAALHAAVLAGLRWLEAGTRDPARLTSDHLLCFRILGRNARDETLSSRVSRLYNRLLSSYRPDPLALSTVADPFDFIDYLCIAALRAEQGVTTPNDSAIRSAVLARPETFFWKLSPRTHRRANCVTLINYYHFERLGISRAHSLTEILSACAVFALDRSHELSEDELEPQIYFATHWVYVLSRYGARRLEPKQHAALYAFLKRILPDAIDYGNVETLAEVVGCLKLFRSAGSRSRLAPAIRVLWKRQNPDGSWGSMRSRNRTHSTCVALTALARYRTTPLASSSDVYGYMPIVSPPSASVAQRSRSSRRRSS